MSTPRLVVAVLLSVLASSVTAPAQIATPPLPVIRASPPASTVQRIGLCDVTVRYHRPATKGRTVFGGIVPWGQLWRAGANENTTVAFTHDVTVEGQPLAAGTYGLHMLPERERVIVIFSRDHESFGSFFYRESADALRVEVQAGEAPATEWLTFAFGDLTDTSATLSLVWGTTAIPMRIAVDTRGIMLAYIEDVYLRGIAGFGPEGHMLAAQWCVDNGVGLEKALGWVDTAARLVGGADFAMLRTRATVLEGLGRAQEAEEALLAALTTASVADLGEYGRQLLRRGDNPGAATIFGMSAERYPAAWDAHDGLATALERMGQKDAAIASYTRALQLAPEAAQQERLRAALQRLGSDG